MCSCFDRVVSRCIAGISVRWQRSVFPALLSVGCGLGVDDGRVAGVEVPAGSSLSRWALCASASRTNRPFAHAAIADAAFSCSCRLVGFAVQLKSPKRSFQSIKFASTATEPSPQPDPTTQTRDGAVIGLKYLSVRFAMFRNGRGRGADPKTRYRLGPLAEVSVDHRQIARSFA